MVATMRCPTRSEATTMPPVCPQYRQGFFLLREIGEAHFLGIRDCD
jgi:hypothetical protein